MNSLPLRFHHFGLAVRRPEEATTFLRLLEYRIGDAIFDPEQNVNLIMCMHDSMPFVEIIYPSANGGETPVDGLIRRHENGIVYHPCYETRSIEDCQAQLRAAGSRAICVSPAKNAVLFGGRRVAFYNLAGIGLIELVEA